MVYPERQVTHLAPKNQGPGGEELRPGGIMWNDRRWVGRVPVDLASSVPKGSPKVREPNTFVEQDV